MLHKVRRESCWWAATCAVALSLFANPSSPRYHVFADEPSGKSKPTKDLAVIHGETNPRIITVSLFSDGKQIRSGELDSQQGVTVHWRKLPVGDYEVHFEAKGFKKAIKRIKLAEEMVNPTVRAELDEKSELVLGGGPSMQELQKQIEKLQQANADLRARVEKLQKEIEQLKKK
jgi:hypothetical protein